MIAKFEISQVLFQRSFFKPQSRLSTWRSCLVFLPHRYPESLTPAMYPLQCIALEVQ